MAAGSNSTPEGLLSEPEAAPEGGPQARREQRSIISNGVKVKVNLFIFWIEEGLLYGLSGVIHKKEEKMKMRPQTNCLNLLKLALYHTLGDLPEPVTAHEFF